MRRVSRPPGAPIYIYVYIPIYIYIYICVCVCVCIYLESLALEAIEHGRGGGGGLGGAGHVVDLLLALLHARLVLGDCGASLRHRIIARGEGSLRE